MLDCAVFRCSTHVELWMSGELDFSQTQRVREYWAKLQEFTPRAILLDLSALQFIDGRGIRTLMDCARDAAKRSQGFAVLAGDNPLLPRLLERLGGRRSLPLYPTRAEAFYALALADRLLLPGPSRLAATAKEADAIRWKGRCSSCHLQAPSALAERFLGNPLPKRIRAPHPLVNAIHEEDRHLVLAVHRQAQDEKRCFAVEYRAISREQELLWLYDVADGRNGGDRTAVRETVTTEITQRKRDEEVGQVREAIFRKLAGLTPEEVPVADSGALSHFARRKESRFPTG